MKVVDGNTACSMMAYKLSDISFIYPITPSSPMASNIDNMNNKLLNKKGSYSKSNHPKHQLPPYQE